MPQMSVLEWFSLFFFFFFVLMFLCIILSYLIVLKKKEINFNFQLVDDKNCWNNMW